MKKIIIAIILLISVLAVIFVLYKYSINDNNKVIDGLSDQKIEQSVPSFRDIEGVELQANNIGGLSVCSDKCGDGICQKEKEAKCQNLNCICTETKADCPQDCQQ